MIGAGASGAQDGALQRGRWNAFISYSHTADRATATRLRNALHAFAKPVFALRRVRVFLDSAALTPDPDLSARLLNVLDQSQHLILLASKEAAASVWVNQEVEHWVRHRGVSDILIVRTSGVIRWGDGDFDWDATDALPAALRGAFPKEPLWLDLGADAVDATAAGPPGGDAQFSGVVGAIASRLLDRPLDELMGEDVAARRRIARLRNGAIGLLSLLTVAAITLAFLAEQQRQQAVAAMARALERSLAINALNAAAGDPDRLTVERSAALAIEAQRLSPSPEAWAAASRMLGLLPLAVITRESKIVAAEFSPDGARLLVLTQAGEGTLHEASGKELIRFTAGPQQTTAAWSPSGRRFATGSADGVIHVFDDSGAALADASVSLDAANYAGQQVQPHGLAVRALAFLSETELLAIGADRIALIDPASGRTAQEIVLPGVLESAVCGRHVALGLSTGEVVLINAGAGGLTRRSLYTHARHVGAIDCAQDGRRVASVGWGDGGRIPGEVNIISEQGTKRITIPGWSRLGYRDDGRLLAVWTFQQSHAVVSRTGDVLEGGGDAGRNQTQLFDAASGALIWSRDNYGQSDMTGFGGGRFVTADERVALLTLSPAAPERHVTDSIDFQVEGLDVSRTGGFAMLAQSDGYLSRIDLDTGEQRRIARTSGQPWTLALSPDESLAISVGDASEAGPQGFRREVTIAQPGQAGGEIRLTRAGGMTVDPGTGDLLTVVYRDGRSSIVRTRLTTGGREIVAVVDGRFEALSFDPVAGRVLLTGDSGFAAVAGGKEIWRDDRAGAADADPEFAAGGRWALMIDDFVYRVRDVASGAVVPLPAASMRLKVAISPDGRHVAAMDEDFRLVVTEQATGRPVTDPLPVNDALSFAFDPRGRWLALATQDSQLKILDLTGGADRSVSLSAPINRDPVPSPDGRFLLLMGDTGLRMIDLDAPAATAERTLSSGFQPELAVFSEDLSLIATGGEDRFARVLARDTGREIVTSRFSAPITSAAISRDQRWAAFASRDGAVRVFDLATGRVWAEIAPDLGWVSKLAFAGEDAWITIEGAGGVAAYRIDPFSELCARQGRNLRSDEWQAVGGSGPAPVSCPGWRS